jgi:hypothetical protein
MTRGTHIRHSLAIGLLLALTIVPALLAGFASDRWGEPVDRREAARRLTDFPIVFGDWQQTEDTPLEDTTLRELRCTGYFNRAFVNRRTGESASAIVMVGPPGPTIRHPPEICYGQRSTIEGESIERDFVDAAGTEQRVRVFEFSRPTAPERRYAVAYGWCAGETWQVPRNPRAAFGAKPLLYKIQVLVDSPAGAAGRDDDAVWRKFLIDFLPAFRQTVLETSSK